MGTQGRHDFPIVFGHVLTPARIPSDQKTNRFNVACSHNLAKRIWPPKNPASKNLATKNLVVRSINRATQLATAPIAPAASPV
jgi:hypothetical protein